MDRPVYVSGADLAAQIAAQRMIGDGGRGLRGPVACESWQDVPPGSVVVGSLAREAGRADPEHPTSEHPTSEHPTSGHPNPGYPALGHRHGVTSVLIVPDHAAGLQALNRGIDHYIATTEVDSPVPEALALQIRRNDSMRSSGFGGGAIDRQNCVDGQAFRWLISYSGAVVQRHGQIGYMILLRVEPERVMPSERFAEIICGRLCETLRSADIVSWLGRYWFSTLVVTGLTLDGAQVLADRLRAACVEPIDEDGRWIPVRCNIGMTTFGGGIDPDRILDRAVAAVDQSTWSNFDQPAREVQG